MNTRFENGNGSTFISLNPKTEGDYLQLLEKVYKKELKKGRMNVPDFESGYFEKLRTSDKKIGIEFTYKNVEFVTVFLEKLEKIAKTEHDHSMVVNTLEAVYDWRFGEWPAAGFTVH